MIRRPPRWFVVLVAGAFGFSTCSRDDAADRVVVYSSVDRVFAEPVLRRASEALGLDVVGVYDTEEAKGTGLVARIVARKDSPDGDLFWSGDPGRAEQVERAGATEPLVIAAAATIAPRFRDQDSHWIGFSARLRVLLVNDAAAAGTPAPTSILDLADPAVAKQVALANPLFGTTSYHAAALAEALGDEKLFEWLSRLRDHGARFAASNGEVKRLVVDGRAAFGLTDSDDAAEAIASGAAVRVVLLDQHEAGGAALGTLVLPNTLSRLRGGPNQNGATRVAEFLLGAEVAAMLGQSCGQVSLIPGVDSPGATVQLADLRAMAVDPAACGARLESLLPRLRLFLDGPDARPK
jgi:iron(III) transport system substrate-binding protein